MGAAMVAVRAAETAAEMVAAVRVAAARGLAARGLAAKAVMASATAPLAFSPRRSRDGTSLFPRFSHSARPASGGVTPCLQCMSVALAAGPPVGILRA